MNNSHLMSRPLLLIPLGGGVLAIAPLKNSPVSVYDMNIIIFQLYMSINGTNKIILLEMTSDLN